MKHAIRFTVLLLSLVALPSAASAQKALVTEDAPMFLNPRPGPQPVLVIERGVEVTIVRTEGDWTIVRVADSRGDLRSGYVESRRLQIPQRLSPPAPEVIKPPAPQPTAPTPVETIKPAAPAAQPVTPEASTERPLLQNGTTSTDTRAPQSGSIFGALLSDAEVQAAIDAGKRGKYDHLIAGCTANSSFGSTLGAAIGGGLQPDGGFTVAVGLSAGRIAAMAENAARLYQPFGLSAVTTEMRSQAVIVAVVPQDPARTSSRLLRYTPPVQHLVLKSKNNDVVTQPARLETEPVSWSNLVGGRIDGNKAVAYFMHAAVRYLPGDIDVIIVTSAGERRCKIGTKDRQRLGF